ncbi:hypothetical protein [uncultured Clostridium sp.]|uniref:hypothetical protein n=1 Tax=uncultured Clostridium sp. TaxID=59620 RepID=UPI00272DA460|nr:hypothetical protein [uncultured Clostridium sp.]
MVEKSIRELLTIENIAFDDDNYLHFSVEVDGYGLEGLFRVYDPDNGKDMSIVSIDYGYEYPVIDEQWEFLTKLCQAVSFDKYKEITGHSYNKSIQMTHNEYQVYLKVLVSRIYNMTDSNKDYTMDNYMKDADNVKITDFDLSQYNLPKEIQSIINSFKTNGRDKFDNELFRGSCSIGNVHLLAKELECKSGYESYNGFYYNLDKKMILEFAEGDVTLILCENEEKYNESLINTIEFYNKNEGADIHYATFYQNSVTTEILGIYVGEREEIHQRFCELAKEYPAIVYDTNLTAKEYESPNNDEIDEEEIEME